MLKKAAEDNGNTRVKVLLASSSAVRRAGLEAIVRSAPTLELAGSLQGTHTAIRRALELQADVLIADLEAESSLPVSSRPSVPCVALIDDPDPAWSARAIRSGVKAILARDSGFDELVAAVMAAYAGFLLLDPEAGIKLAEQVRERAAPSDPPNENLTPREIEVLSMLSEGLGNREIARRLGISGHTIKFHISSILDKLGAATRTEAVTMGLRMGLILL